MYIHDKDLLLEDNFYEVLTQIKISMPFNESLTL